MTETKKNKTFNHQKGERFLLKRPKQLFAETYKRRKH